MSMAMTGTTTPKRRAASVRRGGDEWLIALCDRYHTQQAELDRTFDHYAKHRCDPPETLRDALVDALSDIRDQVADVPAVTAEGRKAKARLLLSDIAEFGEAIGVELAASLARDVLNS